MTQLWTSCERSCRTVQQGFTSQPSHPTAFSQGCQRDQAAPRSSKLQGCVANRLLAVPIPTRLATTISAVKLQKYPQGRRRQNVGGTCRINDYQGSKGMVSFMYAADYTYTCVHIYLFFTARMTNHRNSVARDMIESPSVEVFKTLLERVLGNLIQAPFPTKGWTRWSSEILSSLGCSMIYCFTTFTLGFPEALAVIQKNEQVLKDNASQVKVTWHCKRLPPSAICSAGLVKPPLTALSDTAARKDETKGTQLKRHDEPTAVHERRPAVLAQRPGGNGHVPSSEQAGSRDRVLHFAAPRRGRDSGSLRHLQHSPHQTHQRFSTVKMLVQPCLMLCVCLGASVTVMLAVSNTCCRTGTFDYPITHVTFLITSGRASQLS